MLSVTLLFESLYITSSNCFKTSSSISFLSSEGQKFRPSKRSAPSDECGIVKFEIPGGHLISCNVLKRICEVPPSGIWSTGYNLLKQSADCSYVLLIWRTVCKNCVRDPGILVDCGSICRGNITLVETSENEVDYNVDECRRKAVTLKYRNLRNLDCFTVQFQWDR